MVKKNSLTLTIAFTAMSAIGILGNGGAAQAALLGTETFDTGSGFNDFSSDNYEVNVRIAPGSLTMKTYSFFDPSYPTLFKGTTINLANVGQTYTATQANDPAFNDFAARLTNGAVNATGLILGLPNSATNPLPGSVTLYSVVNRTSFGNYPDLSGFAIDSVSLGIDSLTLQPTAGGREGFGGSFTLSVFGHPSSQPVPESAPIGGILVLGAFGTASLLRRLSPARIVAEDE